MLFAIVPLGGARNQNPFQALLDGTNFTSLDAGPEFYNHQGQCHPVDSLWPTWICFVCMYIFCSNWLVIVQGYQSEPQQLVLQKHLFLFRSADVGNIIGHEHGWQCPPGKSPRGIP
jgi:hypothetical protein